MGGRGLALGAACVLASACAGVSSTPAPDPAAGVQLGFLPERHTDFVVSFDCEGGDPTACGALSHYTDYVACVDGRTVVYEPGVDPELDARMAEIRALFQAEADAGSVMEVPTMGVDDVARAEIEAARDRACAGGRP